MSVCDCGACPGCLKRQRRRAWLNNRRAELREARTGSREWKPELRVFKTGPRNMCKCGTCKTCKGRLYLQRFREKKKRIESEAGTAEVAPIAESVVDLDINFPWLAGLDFRADD